MLIRYDGMTDFGQLQGQLFITRDGEVIEVGVKMFCKSFSVTGSDPKCQ